MLRCLDIGVVRLWLDNLGLDDAIRNHEWVILERDFGVAEGRCRRLMPRTLVRALQTSRRFEDNRLAFDLGRPWRNHVCRFCNRVGLVGLSRVLGNLAIARSTERVAARGTKVARPNLVTADVAQLPVRLLIWRPVSLKRQAFLLIR